MNPFSKLWGQVKPPLGVRHNLAHPLSRGLVGHWLMNEGGGLTLYNIHGSLCSMSINGASWVPTKLGAGLQFSGSSNWAQHVGNENPITMGLYDWTVSVWFKRNVTTSGTSEGLCGCWNAGDYWYLGKWDTDVIRFRINDSVGGAIDTFGSNTILNTEWHHVIASAQRNNTVQIYLDGKPDGSPISITSLSSATIDQGNNEFDIGAIGSHGDFSSYFNGVVADLRTYNRALTPQEVAWLYAEPFADLVAMRTFIPRLKADYPRTPTVGAAGLSGNAVLMDYGLFVPTEVDA